MLFKYSGDLHIRRRRAEANERAFIFYSVHFDGGGFIADRFSLASYVCQYPGKGPTYIYYIHLHTSTTLHTFTTLLHYPNTYIYNILIQIFEYFL